jgi:hypothetical protein
MQIEEFQTANKYKHFSIKSNVKRRYLDILGFFALRISLSILMIVGKNIRVATLGFFYHQTNKLLKG